MSSGRGVNGEEKTSGGCLVILLCVSKVGVASWCLTGDR
jgi:hypothetical protein